MIGGSYMDSEKIESIRQDVLEGIMEKIDFKNGAI